MTFLRSTVLVLLVSACTPSGLVNDPGLSKMRDLPLIPPTAVAEVPAGLVGKSISCSESIQGQTFETIYNFTSTDVYILGNKVPLLQAEVSRHETDSGLVQALDAGNFDIQKAYFFRNGAFVTRTKVQQSGASWGTVAASVLDDELRCAGSTCTRVMNSSGGTFARTGGTDSTTKVCSVTS